MAKSSTISLNIQANTQKAINQFKSFSSDLQNKFLISGLQLDFVRNALSSINREFERYAGGGGLSDAIQTQQLTRSLQTSLSTVQGYSAQVGKALSENIGLALSKINTQVGGNKTDILAFTNEVSSAINEQVALGLTGTKNIVTANEQVFSLMQKLKLGYGVSIEEQGDMFQKVLLNQMSMEDLMNNVSGPIQNLFRTAAFQSGGQLGNMAGVNRGLFLKKVEELSTQFLPSTEELIKTNPQAIIGKLMNTLFDDRVGIFGTLRQIKLPEGGSTTILKEGAELLNALFGEKGLFITLIKEIGRAFGKKEANDAGLVIVDLINFFTEITEKLTNLLQTPKVREGLSKIAEVIMRVGNFIQRVLDSIIGTGKLGEREINELGEALAGALEIFAQILSVALNKLAPKIGEAVWVGVQGLTKGMLDFIFSGNPFGALLGGGAVAIGGIRAFSGFSGFKENREQKKLDTLTENNSLESKQINAELKQNKNRLKEINTRLKELEKLQSLTVEEGDEYKALSKERGEISKNINTQNQRQLDITSQNVESEKRMLLLNRRRESRLRFMNRMNAGLPALAIGGAEMAAGMMGGESWQRSLAKGGLVGASALTSLIPVVGPFIAPIATTLAFGFADKFADALGFTKYNGNFPTAANGLFGAMNKESKMSGNKGLVIANQDEIIAPPHRLAQLAGMVSNMSNSEKEQYALNEKFKKYQDEQKKQMKELISEVKIGNIRKGATQSSPSQVTNNVTNAKLDKDSFPQSFWPSLMQTFKDGIGGILKGILNPGILYDLVKDGVGRAFSGQGRASGNTPLAFLQAYKNEMNAYGGNPVLANDKELIVSPRNYSTFASLLRQIGGGASSASINNQININIDSNGEIDTTKIANAVMKAIDTKYAEAYRSLSHV